MRCFNYPVIQLLIAVLLGRLLCVWLISARGLAIRYWSLSVFAFGGAIWQAWLIHGCATSETGFYDRWLVSQHWWTVIYAVLSLHAFYLLAAHFEGIRKVALQVGAIFAAISVVIVLAVAEVGAPEWRGPAGWVMWIARQQTLLCLLFLAAVRLWLGLYGPVRKNVHRHVAILLALFSVETIGLGMNRANLYPWIANLVISGGALGCFVAWMLALKPSGESFTPPPRLPPGALDKIRFEEALDLQEIRKGGPMRLAPLG